MLMGEYSLFQGDCLEVLEKYYDDAQVIDCIFADPPDNIGLKYSAYDDNLSDREYLQLLRRWAVAFTKMSPIVWISFNSKWTFEFGKVVCEILDANPEWEAKPFIQTFTFGQNNERDCGNGHRPLWRLKHKKAKIYPDSIRVASWRQMNGDNRARSKGKVPLDHWDFPRVVGNSKQRRSYHPTQLNEDLVARAVLLSTKPGQRVLDPFGGTGTTLRVCKQIDRNCDLIEIDPYYCTKMAKEHNLKIFNCSHTVLDLDTVLDTVFDVAKQQPADG